MEGSGILLQKISDLDKMEPGDVGAYLLNAIAYPDKKRDNRPQ